MQCSYHKVQAPLQNCDHHDDIGVMCYMSELCVCEHAHGYPAEVYIRRNGTPVMQTPCTSIHKWNATTS